MSRESVQDFFRGMVGSVNCVISFGWRDWLPRLSQPNYMCYDKLLGIEMRITNNVLTPNIDIYLTA